MNGAKFEFDWNFNQSNWNFKVNRKFYAIISRTASRAERLVYRVPTRTGKPGKMRQLFPVREKSGNFAKMSKSQEPVMSFYILIWKNTPPHDFCHCGVTSSSIIFKIVFRLHQ